VHAAQLDDRDRLIGPERAVFPFFDLQSGERWTVDIHRGPVPWWILDKDRRVRGTSLGEYIDGLRLLNAGERTVTQIFRSQGPFFHRFWEPFTIAVLNTPPDRAAARLLLPVIRETLAQGAAKSTPLIARRSLADTLVAPALAMLQERGGSHSGVASHSLHIEGKAIDIRVPGIHLEHLRDTAKSLKIGGVGFYPASNFVHVDTGRVRYW